jgi:hypothetical protein
MPLAAALVAATLSATPVPVVQAAENHPAVGPDALTGVWSPAGPVCGRQFDPQFVRFVPPAPSSGRNPLLRLIAGRDDAVRLHDLPGSCKRMLTRNDTAP